nr:RNA-directed DNA polymerase, eukaryota [Tanacetum cinerariifolium]
MIFKVDFAKAYDSIRWDYLEAVINSFRFGHKRRSWIRGSLYSSMASILVNGSPTSEFQFHRGLKQGDPLAPYLFILIMESIHLSFSRVIEAGVFTGIKIDSSITLSHLFYADDAVFIGEWTRDNLNSIMHILWCFSLLSGLSINLKKSQLLGVGILVTNVLDAASSIGCSVMHTTFNYLGIIVGGNMSSIKQWDDSINKLKKRLSNWKLKTLSIGGRLTLLKSVLGSTPIYNMSLYKVPKTVLNSMESIRRNFFNGIRKGEKKIAWVKWTKVLAGGLESMQLSQLLDLLDSVILSSSEDRWVRDLNGEGLEDLDHLLFCCSMAIDVTRSISAESLEKDVVAAELPESAASYIELLVWL